MRVLNFSTAVFLGWFLVAPTVFGATQEAPPKKSTPAPAKSSSQTGKPTTGQPPKPGTTKPGTAKPGETKPTGTQTPPAAPKSTGIIDTMMSHLQRMGVKVDKQQSGNNTLVTRYPMDKAAKDAPMIDLVLVYIPSKRMVGFYTYEFGNVSETSDETALYKELLNLNDRLAVGSFFVDKDRDIGLKFAVRTETSLSFDEFQSVYFAMVAVVKQYRGQIREHLTQNPDKNTSAPGNRKNEQDSKTGQSNEPGKGNPETRQRRIKQ